MWMIKLNWYELKTPVVPALGLTLFKININTSWGKLDDDDDENQKQMKTEYHNI